MRSFSQLWPTLRRLLAYGLPWRRVRWDCGPDDVGCGSGRSQWAAAYQLFIDNMVAKNDLPLKWQGWRTGMLGYNCFPPGYITRSRCCLIGRQ